MVIRCSDFGETVRYAVGHSPFYAEHLAGIDADSIRTAGDIRRLGVTSEQDLAGNENRFLCIPREVWSGSSASLPPGTHGKRKRIFFTRNDLAPSVEFYYHAFLTLSVPGIGCW